MLYRRGRRLIVDLTNLLFLYTVYNANHTDDAMFHHHICTKHPIPLQQHSYNTAVF